MPGAEEGREERGEKGGKACREVPRTAVRPRSTRARSVIQWTSLWKSNCGAGDMRARKHILFSFRDYCRVFTGV